MSQTIGRGRRAVIAILTGFGSLLAAFFLVFNGLFSDGPRAPFHPERLVLYALVFVAYGLLAAAGARFGGGRWTTWAVGLVLLPLLVCILYPLREPGIADLAAIEAVAAVAGSALGAWVARRRADQPASDGPQQP